MHRRQSTARPTGSVTKHQRRTVAPTPSTLPASLCSWPEKLKTNEQPAARFGGVRLAQRTGQRWLGRKATRRGEGADETAKSAAMETEEINGVEEQRRMVGSEKKSIRRGARRSAGDQRVGALTRSSGNSEDMETCE